LFSSLCVSFSTVSLSSRLIVSTRSYPKSLGTKHKHVNKLKFLSKWLQIWNAKNKNMVGFIVVVSYEKKSWETYLFESGETKLRDLEKRKRWRKSHMSQFNQETKLHTLDDRNCGLIQYIYVFYVKRVEKKKKRKSFVIILDTCAYSRILHFTFSLLWNFRFPIPTYWLGVAM